MTQRWVAAWLLAIAMSVSARSAHAQSIELVWEAPSPCPTQSELLARVTSMVSRSAVADVSVRAVGQVASKRSEYVLHLRLEQAGRSAERTLHDRDCAELGEAAAFLIAVAIDPTLPPPQPPAAGPEAAPRDPSPPAAGADETPTGDTPAPAPPEPSAATPAEPAAEPAADGGEAETNVTLHVGLFGGAWFGGLAGPQPTLGVWTGVDIGAVTLWFSLAHHFVRSRELSVTGAESRFDGQEAALSGCYLWGTRLRAGPCVRLAALRTHGRVSGVTVTGDDSRLWATGGAALAVRYRIVGALEVQLSGGAWAALVARPRFAVEGLGSVGAVAPIGASLQLGATVEWP